MANTMTIDQCAFVLNDIVAAAQGRNFDPINIEDFTTVGQKALLVGDDPILRGISQVLTRTIFAVRPYYRKFKSLSVSEAAYGNMVRKISYADTDVKEAERFDLPNGLQQFTHNNMYEINKTPVHQENFYGMQTYDRSTTIYRDQMNASFTDAGQFSSFIGGIMQNAQDQIEQDHETLARNLIAFSILAAKESTEAGYSDRVIHLITEYNNATGKALTPANYKDPANYPDFMKFTYALIATVSAMMTERTAKYYTGLTDKRILRHTPKDKQRMYMFAPDKFNLEARVLADTYHDSYLKGLDSEYVNFWQDAENPQAITAKDVTIMKNDGTIETVATSTLNNVFAFLHDKDALGYNVVGEWSAPSPFEARLAYTNIWWHWTNRFWRSDMEKSVIFTLD